MFQRLKRRIHAGLSPVLYGSGLTIVPARVNRAWPQRAFLRRYLKDLRVDCIFDVGANVGQYGVELRHIGYRGFIFSFEPDRDAYRRLSDVSRNDPKWIVFNHALGREEGEATLNVMAVSLFNSFRKPSTTEFGDYQQANSVVEERKVAVDTLGRVLPELEKSYRFHTPFLKMDTQGFDLEVFAGAAPVHHRLAGLQTELSLKRIYEGTPTWMAALDTYQESGFELAGLFPVNPGDSALVEMDCYLRNAGRA